MATGIYLSLEEMDALSGAPLLVRDLYVFGIRPYMSFKTGLCGKSSRISWDGLARTVRVEPAPGIKEVLPTKSQMRRAGAHLVKLGLITMESEGLQLIMRCNLARLDSSASDKVIIKPTRETDTKPAGVDNSTTLAVSGAGGDLDESLTRLGDSLNQAKPPHLRVSEIDQKNSLSAPQDRKFQMTWHWSPFDGDRFAEACALAGVCWDALGTEQKELIRVEFVRYWMAEGVEASQGQWEHRFINSIGYQVRRGVGRLAQQQGAQQ